MAQPWTPDMFVDGDGDACGITPTDFCNALSVWSFMQDRPVSVAEAATTFNTSPLVIFKAVDEHPYLFLSGDGGPASVVIEHEGE